MNLVKMSYEADDTGSFSTGIFIVDKKTCN